MSEKKIYNNFGEFLINAGLTDGIKSIAMKDQLNEYRGILESYND